MIRPLPRMRPAVLACSIAFASFAAILPVAILGCSADDLSAGTPADAAGVGPEAAGGDSEATSDSGQEAGPSPDGGRDATLDAAPESGASDGAFAAEDASPDAPLAFLDASSACQADGGNGGHRWQDLYACYFGPVGVASCGSMAQCHGTPDDTGSLSSGGFVCSPTDQTGCWQSMTSVLVPAGSAASPTMTQLYFALRKTDGTGSMPLIPLSLVFQTGDMARIEAWIEAGAPNN